ncbi:MAG: hypothetical protein JXA21_23820 [Anaerolineae bacterium]|nr:hypothetical protein [Anaerolineae bacterium]
MSNLKRCLFISLVLVLLLFPNVESLAAQLAPQADACLSVAFLSDVTIPDYSEVEGGKSFVKTWRVSNNGTCAWPTGAKLVFSEGEQMGAPKSVAVKALAPGEKTDISVTFKAPTAGGVHQSAWRMSDDKGALFGPRLTVIVKVGTGSATPTPAKPGSATPTPTKPGTGAPSAACLNAGYLADVTIPDYSTVEANKGFTKTWRVRNNGSCDWPADTQITFKSGEQLGAQANVAVGALKAGETKEISVDMKAPAADGSYKGVWRLASGDTTFGTNLTVVIRVGAGSTPATSTPAAPGSSCKLNASYVADVTIPDYTGVEPGQGFIKTWRVRNSGNCDWPADTQITFRSGEQLEAQTNVPVGALKAGESQDVSVTMKAPAANGNYKGTWQLAAGNGATFGSSLTVVIRVSAGSSAAATPAAPTAAPAPTCKLDASYVADVSIPDYTAVEPGQGFVKTWRVRNSGNCDWPGDVQLRFIEGEVMGAPANIAVGTVAPGATADVSVNMVAPTNGGTYKGIWTMAAGDGTAFGGKITIIIRVAAPAPTPAPGVPATPAPVAPQPVRPGSRGGFELGGHIRTWSYIYQMQFAGMTWAKIQVQYGQGASEMINMAHANGFKIQLSALGTPSMVTDADFHAKYSAWVAGLAAQGADAIEVWNEPNIDREWQIGQINPAAYTQLLCAAYGAIKAANPGTIVISAAPAPTGYFGGCGPNGCDDLPFIQGMYNAGAANCMDYIGAHHNSGATSPSARTGHPADDGNHHHSWYFLPQTEAYYNTFRGTRQLFYTEMGYASQDGVPTFSDQFWWGRNTTNAQQAAWLSEAVNLSRSTGMVRCIIVWNIDFVRYGYDPQDGYAIVRPGGSCPACDTLRAVMVR